MTDVMTICSADRRESSTTSAGIGSDDDVVMHSIGTGTSEKRSHAAQTDSPVRASPKYEAFVMTGDKILNLNPKISPSYAMVHRNQLPPTVEVDQTTPKRRGPFDDVPSHSISRIPIKNRRFLERNLPESHSDHHLESSRVESESESINPSNHSVSQAKGEGPINYSTSTLPESGGAQETPKRRPMTTREEEENTNTPNGGAIHEQSPEKEDFEEKSIPNQVYRSTTSMPRCNEVNPQSSDQLSFMGVNVDAEAFARFVQRLFELNGYTRMDVAAYFAKNTDLAQKVVEEFMLLFNFAGLRIDAALRDFLDHVCLTGETSDRTRMLTFFAERYHQCNPILFENADAIHALSCALLLLNTDLHSDVTSKKMTTREFINNLSHTGIQFDRALLKTLYNAIKANPFHHNENATPKKRPVRANSIAQRNIRMVQDAVDYCHGWVMKKEIYDRDGKKTPFGRRKWQMHFATVRGLVLYLHKNEKGFEGSKYDAFNNCIRLHHALAEKCYDYKKKQHVFRLVTAKLGEYLIQTSSPDEMQRWINAINFVAASLSTPVLPEPVSNKIEFNFQKTVLPDAISTLSVHEQLRRHKEKLDEMNMILNKLRDSAPSMKAKGKIVYDYFYRERYLDNERRRYATYVDILQDKCSAISTNGSDSVLKKNSVTVQRNCTISTMQSEPDSTRIPSRQSSVNNKLLPSFRDGIPSNQTMGPRSESTETHRVESPVSRHTTMSALAQAYAVANGKPHNSIEIQRQMDSLKRQTTKDGAAPALCDPRDLEDLVRLSNEQLVNGSYK
ncbi:unnamed protein product [Bursaphelenchus xylophilus]|uniref:(pine wood nematode) hypothetical protein n=1 Tax=Bursaphelenchus xylophilus TaxID=6326 RepID=A0A1I7S3X2_BURXY|nr:unnamed protein product [Bursaphelenchus xylophilus]CAG9116543.1 unnamed protein product [Bursaphelenchus xylophilus]